MHPKYPTLKRQVLDLREPCPKDSLADLEKFYDELTSLGLYVLPKERSDKKPYWEYWKKNEETGLRKHCSRDNALDAQKDDDVSGWCVVTGEPSKRLFVVDMDTQEIIINGRDPQEVYEFIQGMSETGFVLATPAGGAHLYYRIPDEWVMLDSLKSPYGGVEAKGNGGLVISRGGYHVYKDENALNKGVDHRHYGSYNFIEGGEYSHIPLMSEELYQWVKSKKELVKKSKGETYGRTFQGLARVEAHEARDETSQERVVLECLAYVLQHWQNRSYNEWMQLWMSAYAGSNGSAKVRDFIVDHKGVSWSDGDRGRKNFVLNWDKHNPEEEGYTIASLFYLAKQAGWLTKTGYEVPDRATQKINVPQVQVWLDSLQEIPRRLHLISQTGSGKTYAFMRLWERLGKPKSVLFVPSIKLAYELAGTLIKGGLPVTVYIDEKGTRLKGEQMIDAHILVTTLQSFATKVFDQSKGMSHYGLVYIEESDQLIAQFARGGKGEYGTHVSDMEAREGFAVLRSCYTDSKYVWAVDATMSRVTFELAHALCPASTPPLFVKNKWVTPKAPVTMLDNLGEALHVIIDALLQDKRVVVAADTQSQAFDVENVINKIKEMGLLLDKKSIVITSSSAGRTEVLKFFQNVNAGAEEYDLVIYNSAMSSGVSITSVTPDVVVQICNYLTPRVNLQMLNRYRKQKQVFVYYVNSENIYGKSAEDIIFDVQERVNIESVAANVPVATRNSDAELRARLTALSVGDEMQQRRAPREMYRSLLIDDGREIIWNDTAITSQDIDYDYVRTAVKADNLAFKEFIAKTWNQTPPIDRNNPAPETYTREQVAQGMRHAHISYALNGNIPNDVAPEEVNAIVDQFYRRLPALLAYVDKEGTMKRGEQLLSDRGVALTSIVNHVTLVKLLGVLGFIYKSLDEELTEEVVEERADWFMEKLCELKAEYNSVTTRKEQLFDTVYKRKDTNKERAVDFAKILLSHIGLIQKTKHGPRKNRKQSYLYLISNYREALKFLEWRNSNMPMARKKVLTVMPVTIPSMIVTKDNYKDLYKSLSASDQHEVDMMIKNDVCETKFEAMQMLAERKNTQRAV